MAMTLDEAFASFSRDALRLETLSAYAMEDEEAALLTAEAGEEPDLSFLREWHDLVQQARSAGRRYRRLRFIHEPASSYEEVELRWVYPANGLHGEDIRAQRLPADLPDWFGDYWLFDAGRIAIRLVFDDAGEFTREETIAGDEAAMMSAWAEAQWSAARPYIEF
jgi:hypothetical protein